jgi:hypothetical protein
LNRGNFFPFPSRGIPAWMLDEFWEETPLAVKGRRKFRKQD